MGSGLGLFQVGDTWSGTGFGIVTRGGTGGCTVPGSCATVSGNGMGLVL